MTSGDWIKCQYLVHLEMKYNCKREVFMSQYLGNWFVESVNTWTKIINKALLVFHGIKFQSPCQEVWL